MYTVLCVVLIVIGMISLIAVLAGIRPFVMISESMHPEVPRNALVLLDTRSNVTDVAVGDNVAYVLGKVEAMHKVSSVSTSSGENESIESTGVGENKTLIVKSLADEGASVVTPSTYLGKEVLSIPAVGSGYGEFWIISGL